MATGAPPAGAGGALRDGDGRLNRRTLPRAASPGRSPGLERAARAIAAINRRLLAAPRVVGLVLASVVVGPPTAVAAFHASRLEAIGSCLAYALVTALAFVGVAHLLP